MAGHWALAIICFPGLVTQMRDAGEAESLVAVETETAGILDDGGYGDVADSTAETHAAPTTARRPSRWSTRARGTASSSALRKQR